MKKNAIFIIIIIILLGVIVYLWWSIKKSSSDSTKTAIEKTINTISTPSETPTALKEFTNDTYKISVKYPQTWQEKDLGGDKGVNEPLKRENIAFFYLPGSETDKSDVSSAIVSVKLIRFILEKDVKISSDDGWYNYIKKKVDDFIANPLLSTNYQLKSLEKFEKINGDFVTIENYLENDLIRGKDFYIYHRGVLYQFVCKAPNVYFDNYLSYIENIAKSFTIK